LASQKDFSLFFGQIIIHARNKTTALLSSLVGIGRSWPARRLVGSSAVLGKVLTILICTPVAAEEIAKDQRQWWIDHYGLVEARTEPLVARAEEIFSRVTAAADKKGNRLPKLVVIGGKGDPYALTLRDGSVILTLEGLRICYRNAAPETGDSRLAFLVGHELAHLAKDDFWHSNALAAVSSYKDDAEVRRILISQLEKTGGSLDFVKTQELQADSYGILSMTMAGYDPKAIIGPDNGNFFQYWTSQITGNLAYNDALHLSPDARAGFIRTELQPIIDALPRFKQGVQLYQGGNYDVAKTLFESFIEKYPGREVYNNLGLSHYQLAMQSLSACSGGLTVFRLPTALDPETTAQRLRQTAAATDTAHIQNEPYQTDLQEAGRFFDEREKSLRAECYQNASYQTNLQDAIRFFEEAEKKDATYLPARINLSTALIMSGNYAKAISVAAEALNIDPNSPDALNNKSVAEYLFKKKNGADDSLATERTIAPPDRVWAGLVVDIGNFSAGPTILWWTSERFGLQASYGQGTFTSYAIRGLARFGPLWGLTPYVGLGYLNVEGRTDVYGVSATFSGKSGEALAGAVLPITARLSLLSAVAVNNIKLERTVSVLGQDVPVTMDYAPVTVTMTLLYAFF
jgi:tetratricopeptide (TPR) repeat protein